VLDLSHQLFDKEPNFFGGAASPGRPELLGIRAILGRKAGSFHIGLQSYKLSG